MVNEKTVSAQSNGNVKETEQRRRAAKRAREQEKRRRMAERAQEMRDQGYLLKEIAAAFGVSTSTVSAMTRRTSAPPEDSVDPAVICDWAEAHSAQDPGGPRLVNGRPLDDNETRCYHRWSKEGGRAEFDAVERFLCRRGIRFDELIEWAHPRSVWARGEAPAFWDDDSDSRLLEDLQSTPVTREQLESLVPDLAAMDAEDIRAFEEELNADRREWRSEGKREAIERGLLTKDGRARWGKKATGRPRRSGKKAPSRKTATRQRSDSDRHGKRERRKPATTRRHFRTHQGTMTRRISPA